VDKRRRDVYDVHLRFRVVLRTVVSVAVISAIKSTSENPLSDDTYSLLEFNAAGSIETRGK
jgi:hypothetical protein